MQQEPVSTPWQGILLLDVVRREEASCVSEASPQAPGPPDQQSIMEKELLRAAE